MKSPPQPRYLCLWFPDWPLQRLLAAQPDYQHKVVLLTQRTSRGEFVRYCNAFGQQQGVRKGMPVAEARTLAPPHRLIIEEIQPAHDVQALVRLALRCERYSSCIGLEEEYPEALLFDVTGIAPFFGDEHALAEDLGQHITRNHLDGRIAIAETIGYAWAAAHFLAAPKRPTVLADFSQLAALPIAGLRLSETLAVKFARLGLHTIGQVLALDRAAVLRRFGPDTLLRLDQITGRQAELIVPCRPAPKYAVSKALEDGLTQPEAIEHLWSRLLQQLLEQLHSRRLGTHSLACCFALDDRSTLSFVVRSSKATSEFRHVSDLLRLQLERHRFSAPVIGLHLEALEVGPLETVQQELGDGRSRNDTRQLAMLLDRLTSRLGEEAVLAPSIVPDPIPERAAHFMPAVDHPSRQAEHPIPFHVWDRPTVLFPQPRPIDVIATIPDGPPGVLFWNKMRFDVAAIWGPERIESGWWQAPYVCRDYYRVATTAGVWLWVFRRLQDDRWFWHGEM